MMIESEERETNTEYIDLKNMPSEIASFHIRRAGEVIRRGGLAVFPTETVYGLGGDATDPASSKAIYAAKGRPSDNPLIVHIAFPEDAQRYGVVDQTYQKLAKAFMPGPLTVILPKKDTIPPETTGGLDTVAIRCPSHPVAHALILAAGVPIAAPSANISGKPSPTCAEHVADDMMGKVDMILDGGPCEIGLESTIVKIDGPDTLTLLRPGGITYDALCCVCSRVTVANAVTQTIGADERPLSPGMKYKHYAPSVPFVLLDGDEKDILAFLNEEAKRQSCAVLCYEEEIDQLHGATLFPVGKKNDLSQMAHSLFAALREADKAGVRVIYGHLPPMEGLGLALYNRMIRAAAHTVRKLS